MREELLELSQKSRDRLSAARITRPLTHARGSVTHHLSLATAFKTPSRMEVRVFSSDSRGTDST